MKKPNPRVLLITILVISSVCSYVYLRQVSVELPVSVQEEQISELEEEDLDQSEVILPDVTLVKKAFEVGRRFLQ